MHAVVLPGQSVLKFGPNFVHTFVHSQRVAAMLTSHTFTTASAP